MIWGSYRVWLKLSVFIVVTMLEYLDRGNFDIPFDGNFMGRLLMGGWVVGIGHRGVHGEMVLLFS
jgi:hypothetical protein